MTENKEISLIEIMKQNLKMVELIGIAAIVINGYEVLYGSNGGSDIFVKKFKEFQEQQ